MVLVALRYSRAYDRGLGFQAPHAGCSVIASMVAPLLGSVTSDAADAGEYSNQSS
jgi:hypothetical protein